MMILGFGANSVPASDRLGMMIWHDVRISLDQGDRCPSAFDPEP
jgi:hypothetical protein